MDYKEKKKQEERDRLLKTLKSDEEFKKVIMREEFEEGVRKRKDFLRRLQYERMEAALDGVVLKAQEVATLQKNQIEQEEKLAAEMDRIRRQEIKDEKLRQYVRENSHELRELEAQLRAAYVNKALAAQLAEKEANQIEQQIRERRAREIMNKAFGTEEENTVKDLMQEKKQKEEFRRSLQDQIIEKQRQRQEEFMEYMKEKKLLDDIAQKIKDDELKAQEEKKKMQKKLQEEMEQFHAAREVWKAREKMLIEEENKRLEEFTTTPFVDHKKEQMKKAHEAAVDKLIQQITAEMMEEKRRKEEREEIVATLIANELEERENQKAEEEIANEITRRHEARANFQKVLADKKEQKKEQKELDVMFVQQLKSKLLDEEKKEKQKEDQKRQVRVSDRRYNEEAMMQRIQKRAENLKLAQLVNELEEKEEQRKAEMIEQERIRILKEHAPKLLGFFPKGCLRKTDLEILGITSNTPLPEGFPETNVPKQP